MKQIFKGAVIVAFAVLQAPFLSAQESPQAPVERPAAPRVDIVSTMPAVAQALGVTCNYCHVARRGVRAPEPKKDIARAMMMMTREINAKIETATGKSVDEATEVRCVTCHRGVAIPGQLSDVLTQTINQHGVDAAIAQYRDLRKAYYGRQSYDFGEDSLLNTIKPLVNNRPDDAIPILKLNLEFNPQSVNTYMQLAYAYTRKFDNASAIAALEKAQEIEPDNGLIKGQLLQLKSYQRNR